MWMLQIIMSNSCIYVEEWGPLELLIVYQISVL